MTASQAGNRFISTVSPENMLHDAGLLGSCCPFPYPREWLLDRLAAMRPTGFPVPPLGENRGRIRAVWRGCFTYLCVYHACRSGIWADRAHLRFGTAQPHDPMNCPVASAPAAA